MITVICGEDLVSSRSYFTSLIDEYRNKQTEVQSLTVDDLASVAEMAYSVSLFSTKRVFFLDNAYPKLKQKGGISEALLLTIHNNKQTVLLLWEDRPSRELRLYSKFGLKEFKLKKNIFVFLESFYPGNRKGFLSTLEYLVSFQEERFIFLMLARHVRNLLLVNQKANPLKFPSWQIYKLKKQTEKWTTERLILAYESLMKIDVNEKTGSSPFSIRASLDILACILL